MILRTLPHRRNTYSFLQRIDTSTPTLTYGYFEACYQPSKPVETTKWAAIEADSPFSAFPSPGYYENDTNYNTVAGNGVIDKYPTIVQARIDVSNAVIGLGIRLESLEFNINTTPVTTMTAPGLDLSFLDDLDYENYNPRDRHLILNTPYAEASASSPLSSVYLNPDYLNHVVQTGMDYILEDIHGTNVTPPTTPVIGYQFAKDGGLQEDLRNMIFEEAISCIFPDELLPENQPYWSENLYTNYLVESPLEMEDPNEPQPEWLF